MNVLAISSLLAALVTTAIGASVLLRDRTRRTYTSFAAFTFMVAAWNLCDFIAKASKEPLVEWLALWPAATIPPVALGFFREFLAEPAIGGKRRPPRVTLIWTVAAYLALIYAALFENFVAHRWLLIPLGAYTYGSLYRCIFELYIQYRATTSRVGAARIRYLMVGGSVAITLALTEALTDSLNLGTTWPTIGKVLTILYLYFLSQTLFRYRLLDLHELVGKMVVLGTLVVLLWATYGLLLAWVGGGQEGLFLLNALVASFVILVLFEPVRNRLESTISRWLVRQRHELRGQIADVRRGLNTVESASDMVRRIMDAVSESRRLTHACFYIADADGSGHSLAGYHGSERPLDRIEVTIHRPLLERVRLGPIDAVVLERKLLPLRGHGDETAAQRHELEDTLATLEKMHVSLLLPILGSGDAEQGPWLLGLLGFDDDRMEGAFDLDEIDSFRRLAEECARTIESTQVYERVKERDRLAAIGEMAAGLAHEIRNPLGAIKGAAQLIVDPDGNPIAEANDVAEWLHVIVEEVDRLNNVVSQFLDYARPSRTEPAEHAEVNINDVVRRTVQLLETYDAAKNVTIDVRTDELVPTVAGDPEQLRQVFLNLGLNALQAMESGGTLEIVTTSRHRSRMGYGTFAEVRFRDTGEGIAPESIRNLFIPFFTTKQRGTGLGLAISQRIVTQHQGSIEVRSQPGVGSTFSVLLPAIAAPAGRSPKDTNITATQKVAGFRGSNENSV